MFATVRHYTELTTSTADALAAQCAALGPVLESVPGWVSSVLVRTRTGAVLVTLGEDEASLVESGRRVTAWLAAHVEGFRTSRAPDVWAGDVLIPTPSTA